MLSMALDPPRPSGITWSMVSEVLEPHRKHRRPHSSTSASHSSVVKFSPVLAEGQSPTTCANCGGHELEALAYTLANRAPELPQDPDLPRVERLLGYVGLPVLEEAHGLASCGQEMILSVLRGCAKMGDVHRGSPFLWAGSRGVQPPAGPFTLHPHLTTNIYKCLQIW
jgi:hypothetical protein